MTDRPLQDIMADSLRLPRESRAYLAERLIESLDFDDEFEMSPEWKTEIDRRVREIDEGAVQLIPADDLFARMRNGRQG